MDLSGIMLNNKLLITKKWTDAKISVIILSKRDNRQWFQEQVLALVMPLCSHISEKPSCQINSRNGGKIR